MRNKGGKMKIGIFDSGVGGLIIAKAIRKLMPEYDYVYLGDTKRVPYGPRSHDVVFEFTKEGINYLFKKENCVIVILACNTASASSLRRIQQEYLPTFNTARKLIGEPEVNVLGVLIPTAEECTKYNTVGVIGTSGTIASNTFPDEIEKINNVRGYKNRKTKVFQNPAPILVSLAEEGEKVLAKQFIIKYLKPFLNHPQNLERSGNTKIEALALGCTHYPFFKNEIREILPKNIKIISQDEIVPKKLKDYFDRHPEITKRLSRNKQAKILVTVITKNIEKLSKKWFGKDTKPELVKL
jgi:glutamate racemase